MSIPIAEIDTLIHSMLDLPEDFDLDFRGTAQGEEGHHVAREEVTFEDFVRLAENRNVIATEGDLTEAWRRARPVIASLMHKVASLVVLAAFHRAEAPYIADWKARHESAQ